MKSSWLGGVFSRCIKCSPFLSRSAVLTAEESDHEKIRRPGGWKCMPYIIGNEAFEKVAMLGVFVNLTVYLVSHFNMPQVVAANVANIFSGTANFAPLLGAFVSDAYWGRYRTLAYAYIATFLGMLVLTLTTIVPELRPPACTTADQLADRCVGPSRAQTGVLVVSMILLTAGAGGIRPCSLPFGVDQFDKSTEQGRRGLASFFSWYYCTSTARGDPSTGHGDLHPEQRKLGSRAGHPDWPHARRDRLLLLGDEAVRLRAARGERVLRHRSGVRGGVSEAVAQPTGAGQCAAPGGEFVQRSGQE